MCGLVGILGGMFIEHYYENNGMDAMNRFYEEAVRVGFKVIEEPYVEGRFHHIGFEMQKDPMSM